MTHATKIRFERVIARRSGALWREHVMSGSIEQREADDLPVWSRRWLSRRGGLLASKSHRPTNI